MDRTGEPRTTPSPTRADRVGGAVEEPAGRGPTSSDVSGESRRRALAKIGIGGAALWAAPMVATIDASAAAASSEPVTTEPEPPDDTEPAETTTTSAPPETTTSSPGPAGPQLDVDFSSPVGDLGYSTMTASPYTVILYQPFVAGRTGDLVEVELLLRAPSVGTAAVRVDVYAAEPSGEQVGPVLGSAEISGLPTRPVPQPPVSERFSLSPPVPLVAGNTYVVVVSPVPTSEVSFEVWNTPLRSAHPMVRILSYIPTPFITERTLHLRTFVS